jgi:hypothetical protein
MIRFVNNKILSFGYKSANLIDIPALIPAYLISPSVIVWGAWLIILLSNAALAFSLVGATMITSFVLCGGLCLLMIAGIKYYNEDLDTDNYARDLNRIRKLLHEHGPMPMKGIQYHYKQLYRKKLTDAEIERRFEHAKDIIFDVQTQTAQLLGMFDYDDQIPLPKDTDYVAGYYQMYQRLKMVKAHSEYADVPLSVIDSVINI